MSRAPETDVGRRRHSRRARGSGDCGPRQRPFHQPSFHAAPTSAVSEDELEAIHLASLAILRDIGIDVLHPEARTLLTGAGATVDSEPPRVRFDPDLVTEIIANAPSEFTLHARNPAHHLRIGGNAVAFGAVASAPNVTGLGEGRRVGTARDFRALVRLSQCLEAVHFHGGYPVEPIDIHPSVRHLHATFDLLTLSDKAIHSYSLGRQRTLDTIEMTRIARRLSGDELDQQPSVFTVVNTSSPLRLDGPMIEGMIELSARNQPVVVTPFTLAGAMAPVTIAGALAQQNAEALAGIALTQVIRRGAPVVYGGFTSNVDMRSGAPAFGTPEYVKAALVGGQLARRYGLPYRSSNVNAANSLDAQAAYESLFSLWGAVMGGANMIFHAAGWMKGGLCASFEKMVLDAELLQMIAVALEPLVVDDDSLALDAIAEVGPGGHFFGADHTRARYRTAFHSPMVSDWRNYEAWDSAGRPTGDRRLHSRQRSCLRPPRRQCVRHRRLEPRIQDDRRRQADGRDAGSRPQAGRAEAFHARSICDRPHLRGQELEFPLGVTHQGVTR
ncbi:MAG: trimethylamine methyltransferase family protein [Acidimicrobiia bacterium]|nr:trimethylamine methyltransferase family protein [Acidimicrobiia bacterium]